MSDEREWVKQIFRVVCVVNDLDSILANWKRLVEFDEASIRLGATDENAKCVYKGKEIRCPTRYARFDLGGVDMKFVEPLNRAGGDPYSDCLLRKGQGFHHLGIYTESLGGLLKKYEAMGIQPSFEEMTDRGRAALYDFNERIGMSVVPQDHMVGPCAKRDGRRVARRESDRADTRKAEKALTKLKPGPVCQVAVVVRGLESGLAEFRKLLGIDEASLSFSRSDEAFRSGRLRDVTYRGNAVKSFNYRQYNFFMGGMDIEMFAPEDPDESNPFADFLKECGPGIHHLNIGLHNREEGLDFLKNEQGIAPFFDLYHLGRNCAYFDLRKELGLVAEIGSRIVGPRASMTEEEIENLIAY
jgi:hypothetical protein